MMHNESDVVYTLSNSVVMACKVNMHYILWSVQMD